MSFADKLVKSRSHLVRLVTGKSGGYPAWWVVQVDHKKHELYKKQMATGDINLDDFGEVIAKGWGETAPEDVIKQIEDMYS